MALVKGLHFQHAIKSLEGLGRDSGGKRHRDLVALDGLHLGYAPDAHEAPVANDTDCRASLLDLTQHVR